MEVGQEMMWNRFVGNYGFHYRYRVRVEKIGKRVTVTVLQNDGTEGRRTVVRPESLEPLSTQIN